MKTLFSILFLSVFSLEVSATAETSEADAAKADPTWAIYNKSLQQIAKQYGPEWIEKKENPDDEAEEGAGETTLSRAGKTEPAFYPLSIPMCFLFDSQGNDQKVNEKIHGMEKAYAACGISLQPRVFTIKANYPPDSDLIVAMARKACPIEKVFHGRGAIQVETQFADLPKKMCHDPKAQGCSTLCSVRSVSVLVPDAGFPLGLHESMHSNCCGPLCVDKGRGEGVEAGFDLELASIAGGESKVSPRETHSSYNNFNEVVPITPAGCEALRQGAMPTDWAKQKRVSGTTAYTLEKDPTFQYDLMAGKSFFEQVPGQKTSPGINEVSSPEKSESEAEWGFQRLLSAMQTKILSEPSSALPLVTATTPAEAKTTFPSLPNPVPATKTANATREIAAEAPIDDRQPGTGLRKWGAGRRKTTGSNIREVEAHGDAELSDDGGSDE